MYFVFVAVVGIDIEVGDDPDRSIRKCCKSRSLQERISDRLNGAELKRIVESSTDAVGVWRVVGRLTDVVGGGPTSAGACKDLVQFLRDAF